jgi:fatty acid kinase fatty acid binding subunit
MKELHIVTDSSAQIPDALCQELDIKVIPLLYVWDGKEYSDFDMGPREFYAKLRNSKTIPQTSNPTPKAFKEEYERLETDGKPVLLITLGTAFSRTFEAAVLAKEMVSNVNVTVFDSGSNSMGLGFQVLAAARAARDGKGINEILEILEQVKRNTGVLTAFPHIEYLLRGGRANHLQYFLATTLKLIPIAETREGAIKAVERVRYDKNVIPRLLDLLSERLENHKPVRIAVVHADAESKAWELAKQVRQRFSPDELITSEINPALGSHAGPDTIGLAYSSGY